MNIAVYCASSDEIDAKYFKAAERLGRLMAEKGLTMVNGAGRIGLMGAASDASLSNGGRVIGVIPGFMVENGWNHPGLSETIQTPDIQSRQAKMAEISDAAIALPGGIGTLAELSEVSAWKQLDLYHKPIVILNTDGYWDELLLYLERAHREHFMRKQNAIVWDVASTPEEAIDIILSSKHH